MTGLPSAAPDTGRSGRRKEALADLLRRRSGAPAEREARAAAVQFSLGALTRAAEGTVVEVPLAELHANPVQPRFQFHRQPLEELAQSLASEGQLEAVIARRVQRDGAEVLEVVAGARRLAAARICNASIRPFPTLRVDVRALADDEAERISLIENLQRENLSPLEEGYRYWQLQQRDPRTWSVRAIAEFVHKKKSTVQNRLGLVKDPAVAEAVLREQVPPTAGFHILRLPAPEREAYLRTAVAGRLTVEQIKADVDRRVSRRPAALAVDGAAPRGVAPEAGGAGEEGEASAPAVVVRAHLRRARHDGDEDEAEWGRRRAALEGQRAALLARIEQLEAELRDHLAVLRSVERDLAELADAAG